ncbi:MAG: hypothetical protein ABIA63_12080 [bacterium]
MSSNMQFNRQSHRMKGWDYRTPASYFVTLCTTAGICFFQDKKLADVVTKYWLKIPKRQNHVELDEFVVMPNHLHGIIIIKRFPNSYKSHPFPGQPPTGAVGAFSGNDKCGPPVFVGALSSAACQTPMDNVPTKPDGV